jgi:uncharacterized protein (TIGR01777 family)
VKVLVSGSLGFIGRRLVDFLRENGHGVFRLVRAQGIASSDSIVWDPESGQIAPHAFDGFDAVIHLAGKNLTDKRWTKSVKQEIFLSRCRDTWLLAQGISRAKSMPKIVITASAVGYYGDCGEEVVDENSPKGEGFLSDVCDHWERAAEVLVSQTRVVHTRFGVVLAPHGGMFAKIAPIFRNGLGAVLGNGKQWMSWIGLEDLIRAIDHILNHATLNGPVNVCTDNPIRNEEFCYQLAQLFQRKCVFRAPAFMLKLLLGEIAKEMLLSSTRVAPTKLQKSGFSYLSSTLPQLFQAFGYN